MITTNISSVVKCVKITGYMYFFKKDYPCISVQMEKIALFRREYKKVYMKFSKNPLSGNFSVLVKYSILAIYYAD